jgi:tetratricopeptide (TPR) repeat protein
MARTQALAASLILLLPTFALPQSTGTDGAQQSISGTALKANASSIDKITLNTDPLSDQELRQLFVQYKDAVSVGMWDEADTLAKKIVGISIETNGRDSKVTAVALTNLGILQKRNDDPASAVQNFATAIEIVERLDNRLSADLIVPLKEMGAAQLKAGNADHAVTTWYRAVHISHVNFGPHNLEQIEPLYELARMYSQAGLIKEAYKVRKRIYYLQSRERQQHEASLAN